MLASKFTEPGEGPSVHSPLQGEVQPLTPDTRLSKYRGKEFLGPELWVWDTCMKVEPGPRGRGSLGRRQDTCDESRDAPAQHVVETHGAGIDVSHLCERPVQV